MWFRTTFALIVVCALCVSRPAQAGPVEQMVQVALHPTDPKVMTIRYTWGGDGLLRTTDGGSSWSLICDSLLFDATQTHAGQVVIGNDGTMFMAVFSGLYHDDKTGCGWKSEPQYDMQWMGDLVRHPSDPNVIFGVTSSASTMTEKKVNGVIRRDADGTWHDVGTKVEMLATRVHVVTHGSGLRYYVGAIEGQVMPPDGGTGSSPNYVTRVSDDDGQTWKENVFGTIDGTFRIQAVDPTNPDRLVASVNRASDDPSGGDDTVMISTDQGAHFTEYMKLTEIGGVTFAPDGRLWIGDAGDTSRPMDAPGGLWFAKNLDAKPTLLANGKYPVQCLQYQSSTDSLFACQRFWFGKAKPDDGTFTSMIKFTEVNQMVSCPGVDVAGVCQMQLCNAYCGFSHFAVAPFCSAYNTDTCGIPVQKIESDESGSGGAGGSVSANGGSSGGLAGTTGGTVTATPAGGGAAGTLSANAGAPAFDAGVGAGQPAKKKSSGCNAAGDPFATGQLAWLGLAALVTAWRGRRRTSR